MTRVRSVNGIKHDDKAPWIPPSWSASDVLQRALRALLNTFQELLTALIYGVVFSPFIAIALGVLYYGGRIVVRKASTVTITQHNKT